MDGIRRERDEPDGFTLIELLIVLTLISVLASLAIAQYRHSIVYAREAVLKKDLSGFREALDQYYADKSQYPVTLEALVSDGYLRAIPQDPFTRSNTTWQTVAAGQDPGSPTAGAGVYDVKSGSDAIAFDGSRYAEW